VRFRDFKQAMQCSVLAAWWVGIASVTPATARVRLLTAPGHEIGVWLPRSRSHGLLVGRGSSRLTLQFIDKDPNVSPGDLVTTSPASTLLPTECVGGCDSVAE
jgi:rod shape-determining protein MreC